MLHSLEPGVVGAAGLWSPSTGIVDSHTLMLALQGDLEAAGGMLTLASAVTDVFVDPEGLRVIVESGAELTEVRAKTLVNAAGLHAARVATRCRGVENYEAPPVRYAKGNYFTYAGPSPFEHLLYPLPVDGGLGVHVTLDLAGRVRFGPDVEWCETIDYAVDASRAAAFHAAIRDYWPAVELERLLPAYSGIRPKLHGPGEPAADFRIDTPVHSARAHLIHLLGIESPGLTAALAIAKHVRELLERE
jgi:L-2-hydroxyglutarate oxidase LhgO